MAFTLAVSETVLAHVKGATTDEEGRSVAFDFSLVCERKTAEELRAIVDSDVLVPNFMKTIVRGWRAVLDAQKQPVPFDAGALDQLLNIAGMAGLAFNAYLDACGARARQKN